MLEKLKRLNPLTSAVWVGCLVALVAMVLRGWTAAQIAATAAAFLTVTSQLDRLVPKSDEPPKDPPPGAIILPFAVSFAIAAILSACAWREMEAETAYANEQYKRCVEPEPILGSNASREERAAAWARVDACRDKVRQKWDAIEVTETVTTKDGGR